MVLVQNLTEDVLTFPDIHQLFKSEDFLRSVESCDCKAEGKRGGSWITYTSLNILLIISYI